MLCADSHCWASSWSITRSSPCHIWVRGFLDPDFGRPIDQAVRLLIALLLETKFYLLFSFLFGYSFTLQIDVSRRAGADPVARLRHRLLGLILLAYGLIGLLLLR